MTKFERFGYYLGSVGVALLALVLFVCVIAVLISLTVHFVQAVWP